MMVAVGSKAGTLSKGWKLLVEKWYGIVNVDMRAGIRVKTKEQNVW